MLLILIIIIILGLSLGSFANCLIWRLYRQEKIIGRSYCPKCLKKIYWYDNIPLFSYFRLGGRCRFCHQSISWQYPLVELITALLFIFFWFKNLDFVWLNLEELNQFLHFNFWLTLIRDYVAIFVLIVIFVFDLRFYLVSNIIVIPAIFIFICLNLLLGASWQVILFSIIGAISFFGLQFLLTRGRGLGEGDIWLGILLASLFSDWNLLVLAILLAYFLGTIVGLILIITRQKKWSSKLPLGVFLSLGALISLAWGKMLLTAFWHLQL